MQPRSFKAFLTFVGIVISSQVVAAPTSRFEPSDLPTGEPQSPTNESSSATNAPAPQGDNNELEQKGLILVVPKAKQSVSSKDGPQRIVDREFFYEKAITLRLGFLFEPDFMKEHSQIPFLIGGKVYFIRPKSMEWELGVDFASDSIGRIFFGPRYTFWKGEAVRPFVKSGLNCRLVGKEQLATFLEKDNYQIKVGFGIEDLIGKALSVVIEFEGQTGLKHTDYLLASGLSWAW